MSTDFIGFSFGRIVGFIVSEKNINILIYFFSNFLFKFFYCGVASGNLSKFEEGSTVRDETVA